MAATWSFVGYGQSTPVGSVASVSIAPAAGTAQGDIIIAVLTMGPTTVTLPSGWYSGGSATNSGVIQINYAWTKLATVPAANYSFGFSPNSSSIIGVLLTYRGAEFGNDYTGVQIFPNAGVGATTVSGTAINTADDLHFCAWGATGGGTPTITPDAALTSRFAINSADAQIRLTAGDEALSSTTIPARTSVGAGTFQVNCSSNHGDSKWPRSGDAWAWIG